MDTLLNTVAKLNRRQVSALLMELDSKRWIPAGSNLNMLRLDATRGLRNAGMDDATLEDLLTLIGDAA